MRDIAPTNVSRFDSNTRFNMCFVGRIGLLVLENIGLAEGVYESRATSARRPCTDNLKMYKFWNASG